MLRFGRQTPGHELRLHLDKRDFHVADAAGGRKGVRTRVGHDHLGRLAGDLAAAEDADRALRDGHLAARTSWVVMTG